MRWVAPTGKDTANQTLEKGLWAAADQFRANSGLKDWACGFGTLRLAISYEASKESSCRLDQSAPTKV